MSFLIGVLCGVILTIVAVYGSITIYLFEPPAEVKNEKEEKEHGIQPNLIDNYSNRDAWFNHLINFVYREFCNSDKLHNFVLKKLNVELEEIRTGPAARFLSKIELREYKFGSRFPLFKNFCLTEPEGFDSEVLPDSLSIEFDIDYEVNEDQDESPFKMSADALPVFFGTPITVTVGIKKMKGRLRLHLSRTPALLWYASFVAKPELDFVIETNLNTKYSSTIENIFSSHLQRLVTRKHTVPKFKVRYSPFFSLDAFKMSPPSGDFENFIDLNFVSAKLEIIAQRGRGFPIHHKGDHPASTCFVTFNFSPDDWPEILKKPKNVPATTQTSQLVQKEDVEEENAPVNDEFINISIGKSSNSPVCEDETESDLDEPSREPIAVQVGKESRRAKLTATYGKFKEMAKVGKERIEPVLRRRGRADTNNSTKSESGLSPRQTNVVDEHDGRASDSNVPGPSSGIRRKNNSTSTDSVEAKVREKELISIWNIISSQPEFYRTKYAPSINGNYQWRYEQINGDVKREHNFLHVAVWEKPHGIERPILMGYVSLPLNIIYAKAAQTLGKSFIRKVRLSPPDDFDFERMKINIGEVASNRGFRKEMAFGELTLKIKLSSKDDKVKEKSTASAQTDHIETQSFSSQIQSSSEVMSPGTVTSRGRNLIGNIKQKFWTDKTRKNELPICSTPEPVQRILTTGSRSTSATSLKIDNQNNTQSDTFECSESEEYFVPLSHAAIDNSPEIEIATVPDESDAHLVNATARHYPVLVAKTPLDSLAAVAKEEGSKLHRDLPGRERRDTIEQQISKIESEIDAEIGRKKKLESDLRSASPISIKQSVEKNLDKCKERLNALTMLSMSYQAGMTDADTPED